MIDRRSIIYALSTVFTMLLTGCSEIRNNNTTSEPSNNSSESKSGNNTTDVEDIEGVTFEFEVIKSECMVGKTIEDLEDINNATIEFHDNSIYVEGIIADGEPNRTAELRDYEMIWSESTLYVDVFHTEKDGDDKQECNTKTTYKANFEYEFPQNRANDVRVRHNGRRAGKSEVED